MSFDLNQARSALIVGAGHGIGYALVAALLKAHPNLSVWATYRDQHRAQNLLALKRDFQDKLFLINADVSDEAEIIEMTDKIQSNIEGKLDLCLLCIGILHDEAIKPEKSLNDINKRQLLKYFEMNSIIMPMLAKHLKPLFSHTTPSVFASLSAKVGSIGDNVLGGWYGYRASKAALNMFIKNVAIEFKRLQLQTIVLSIHPGTTATALSTPYLSHIQHRIWQPEESAEHILAILHQLELKDSGTFKHWDGSDLMW